MQLRQRLTGGENASWLHCRVCQFRIVKLGDEITFDGAHQHEFINPVPLKFSIELFAYAPGLQLASGFTDEFSWFAGYEWSIGVCSGCRTHLGWRFQRIGPPGPIGITEPAGFDGLLCKPFLLSHFVTI